MEHELTALERSARQYAVAGEASFLESYRANRAAFQASIRQLEEIVIRAEGDGAEDSVAALARLVEDRFGED